MLTKGPSDRVLILTVDAVTLPWISRLLQICSMIFGHFVVIFYCPYSRALNTRRTDWPLSSLDVVGLRLDDDVTRWTVDVGVVVRGRRRSGTRTYRRQRDLLGGQTHLAAPTAATALRPEQIHAPASADPRRHFVTWRRALSKQRCHDVCPAGAATERVVASLRCSVLSRFTACCCCCCCCCCCYCHYQKEISRVSISSSSSSNWWRWHASFLSDSETYFKGPTCSFECMRTCNKFRGTAATYSN